MPLIWLRVKGQNFERERCSRSVKFFVIFFEKFHCKHKSKSKYLATQSRCACFLAR